MMTKQTKATPKRWATAYHEAGHAVVHIYFGLPIGSVTIRPSGDVLGSVQHPPPMALGLPPGNLARERRRVAREMILACYAGLAAQRLVDPEPEDFHGQGDDESAFELSREYAVFPRHMEHVGDDLHHRYLDRLRAEAARLVGRLVLAVSTLAHELIEHETLTGQEAARVVAPILE